MTSSRFNNCWSQGGFFGHLAVVGNLSRHRQHSLRHNVLHLCCLFLIQAPVWVSFIEHCDGFAKLCLLQSEVGLQLVQSTEHLCLLQKGAAAAVEARCLLQDREEGAAGSKLLAFPEHLPSAPRFQKTVVGISPSSPQLKNI